MTDEQNTPWEEARNWALKREGVTDGAGVPGHLAGQRYGGRRERERILAMAQEIRSTLGPGGDPLDLLISKLEEDPAQRMLKSIVNLLRTSTLCDQKGGDMKPADVADVLEREFGEGDA